MHVLKGVSLTAAAAMIVAAVSFADASAEAAKPAHQHALEQCIYFDVGTVKPVSLSQRVAEAVTAGSVRFATINAQLVGEQPGELAANLRNGQLDRAKNLAAILQIQRPKVVALTGFDFDEEEEALELFHSEYLNVSQDGHHPIQYKYRYTAPVNTGVDSGADLNKDGLVGGPEDNYGHGEFPGQGGMVFLSQLPIDEKNIRTFTDFKWDEVPENNMVGRGFTKLERSAMPLHSRGMWDIPIQSGRNQVHVIVTHLNPIRDLGAESADRDRYLDQMSFLRDYLEGGEAGEFIVDDAGQSGGLNEDAAYVVAGQLNADPAEEHEQRRLLRDFATYAPFRSQGAHEALDHSSAAATTLEEQETLGEYEGERLNYVLAQRGTSSVTGSGVHWPRANDARFLAEPDEDGVGYRMVWSDIKFR